jgi:hypothetical protein
VSDVTSLAPVGSCFGYAVSSNAPLVYAREGTGAPLGVRVCDVAPAAVDAEPIMTMHAPVADGAVTGEVFRDADDCYRMWVAGAGWFTVDVARGFVEAPATTSPVLREEGLWSVPGRILLAEHGDLPLHAAAVEIDGRAVVMAAPTRYGKTTLAGAFAAEGFRLLTEDLAAVRFMPHPVVLPGPAFLRLRRDVAGLLSIPGATVVAESDTRVHLALDPAARGSTAPVSVSTLVLLRLAGDVSTAPAETVSAIRDVWSQGFALPNRESRSRAFESVGRLVESVPVVDMGRPLTPDALRRAVEVVAKLVATHG